MRCGAEVLEADAYGEKLLRLVDGTLLKLFRRKRLLSSALYSPYAQRFADNTAALARLGILVPEVVDVMRIASIRRDAVRYRPLPGTMLRKFAGEQCAAQPTEGLKRRFNEFVTQLHEQGIYFRSLHLGNVILTPGGELGLIDFADLRFYGRPLPGFVRARNIRRLLGIASERDWIDRERILCARRLSRFVVASPWLVAVLSCWLSDSLLYPAIPL